MKAGCDCCGGHGSHCEGCLAEAEPIKEPQTSANVVGEGIENFFLLLELAPDLGLTVPLGTWPDVARDDGLTRIEPVPVPPPRA